VRTRTFPVLAALFAAFIGCTKYDTGPNISGLSSLEIVSVKVQPKVDTITLADTTAASVEDRTLHAVAIGRTLAELPNIKFVWRSLNPAIATVDSSGVVTPVSLGAADITASASKVGHARIVVIPAPIIPEPTPGVSVTLRIASPSAPH
jgi:uncharacterized protein YjdB